MHAVLSLWHLSNEWSYLWMVIRNYNGNCVITLAGNCVITLAGNCVITLLLRMPGKKLFSCKLLKFVWFSSLLVIRYISCRYLISQVASLATVFKFLFHFIIDNFRISYSFHLLVSKCFIELHILIFHTAIFTCFQQLL